MKNQSDEKSEAVGGHDRTSMWQLPAAASDPTYPSGAVKGFGTVYPVSAPGVWIFSSLQFSESKAVMAQLTWIYEQHASRPPAFLINALRDTVDRASPSA